jgi:hypothetical protein
MRPLARTLLCAWVLLWAVATPADAGSEWFLLMPPMDSDNLLIFDHAPLSQWVVVPAYRVTNVLPVEVQ